MTEDKSEQELREKIAEAIFSKTTSIATHTVWGITDQILAIVDEYYKESGWKSPEELKGYVKLAEDQRIREELADKGKTHKKSEPQEEDLPPSWAISPSKQRP